MLSPDLVSFVKEGLGRGLSRGEIEDILVRAGWPADQVRRSLAGFADIESPIPPLVALGSLAGQRRERLDARRAQDLQVIFAPGSPC